MLFFLEFIASLLHFLKEGDTPKQLAAGLAMGFILGFTPDWPLHLIIVLVASLIFRINLALVIVSASCASVLAWLVHPWIDQFGHYLLTEIPMLQILWTHWYNNPIMMLTHFNNTLVMGSFVASVPLSIAFFSIGHRIIKHHQTALTQAIMQWPIVQSIIQSSFYRSVENIDVARTTK